MEKWEKIRDYCNDNRCQECKFAIKTSCPSHLLLMSPCYWTEDNHPSDEELKGIEI